MNNHSQLPEEWYVKGKDARRRASERPVDLPPTSVEHPADTLIKEVKEE